MRNWCGDAPRDDAETQQVTIEMVFFDVGLTLLHPYPSFAELFAATCRENGVPVTAEEVERVQDRLAPHLMDLATESGVEGWTLSDESSRAFWSYLYRRFLAELGHDESMAEPLVKVFSNIASYKLFDDVVPTIEQLEAAGYRLGLISNFEGWLEEMLVELEIGHRFDPVVISALEGIEKPDPKIYELALERAGVAPGVTVHVGDTPSADVEPARLVGITPVLLDRHDRYPNADGNRIATLQELPGLLANL
jgi:putative hydrolase of the HAD superfamily